MRVLAFLLVLGLLAAGPAAAQTLYWVETNHPAPFAWSAAADGSGAVGVPLGAPTLPEGVAFDESHRKIYWVESSFSGARVRRANVDWSGVEDLVRGGSSFRGIALDEVAGTMYWTSSNQVEGGKIRRANLDGSFVEVVLELGPGANPRGIALDRAAGKMYWADAGLHEVRRANLDGSAPELVVATQVPYGVAVDPAGGHVYWSSFQLGNISRLPIAGGPSVKVKSALEFPTHLAHDPAAATIYWIEDGSGSARLRRGPTAVVGTVSDLANLSSYGGLAFSPSGIVGAPSLEPVTEFALGRVVPNPASGPARIGFALPRAARVRLELIDVRGRAVATLLDGELPAGRHERTWGGDAAPGIYFLRLVAPGFEQVRRVVRLP
jgi:hypothetical protein